MLNSDHIWHKVCIVIFGILRLTRILQFVNGGGTGENRDKPLPNTRSLATSSHVTGQDSGSCERPPGRGGSPSQVNPKLGNASFEIPSSNAMRGVLFILLEFRNINILFIPLL